MACLVFRKRFPLFGDEVFWERISGQQFFIHRSVLLSPVWGTRSSRTRDSTRSAAVGQPFCMSTGLYPRADGDVESFYLPGGEDMTRREFLEAGELGSVVCVWMRNSGGTRARWQKGGKGRD